MLVLVLESVFADHFAQQLRESAFSELHPRSGLGVLTRRFVLMVAAVETALHCISFESAPSQIASAVGGLMLLVKRVMQPDSAYVTGQLVAVDGGYLAQGL